MLRGEDYHEKIFVLMIIVSCFILSACGGPTAPTAKEEAIKLHDIYVKHVVL